VLDTYADYDKVRYMDQIIKILLKHCTCEYQGKCRTCQYLIDEEKEVTDELYK